MNIQSTRIYTEEGVKSGVLPIENGVFGQVRQLHGHDVVDYGSLRIIPGIFDTHIHGTCGYSLMGGGSDEENARQVRGFLRGCASQGTTSVFPTADVAMIGAVAAVARQADAPGAEIVGIHSEGPWLNRTGEKGIWTPWPAVSLDTARQMVADGDGLLRLVALAPEIEGIDAIIDYFLAQNVTVAFAHSNADYSEAMAAFKHKGLTVSTHTGNVMTGLHHRKMGGLGAALLDDDVMCEVICDGMHICNEMLRIFFRVKDPARFMMVSDCTPFSGAPAGRYPKAMMDMDILVGEDGFVLSDTGRLCGSSQPVLYGVGNLVERLHLPLETVLQMAALNPSKAYGLAHRKGSIAPGKDADFVIITDDYQVVATYVGGRKVYDRATGKDVFNPTAPRPAGPA